MPASGDCAAARMGLGAYVLGTMDPAERSQLDAHLSGCARCREELVVLAGLPALLRRVSDSDVERVAEAPSADESERNAARLVRRMTHRRRRRRTVAAAAAVTLAAGAGVAAVAIARPGEPAAGTSGTSGTSGTAGRAWSAPIRSANPVTGTQAAVRYAPRSWGTAIEARITGVGPGISCELWVLSAGGKRVAAGGWISIAGGGSAWHAASVPLRPASLRAVEITGPRSVLAHITLARPAQS